MEKDMITMKKTTLWQIATGVLAVLLVISIFTNGFRGNDNGSAIVNNQNNNDNQPTIPSGVANVNAEDYADDDPVLGNDNAQLTIVEFSDFQCPYCKRFRDQTFDQLKKQYIDTGKVKLVYRDFPLSSIHPMAQKAAEAGECADEQGKFWEYHDKIYENQQLLSIDSLKQWAKDLSLDTTKFNNCLDSEKYANEVKNDLNDATSSGGQGTPYFLVGNTQLSGAYPFDAFQQAIEAQL
jgi:protein-disulfide isomerase